VVETDAVNQEAEAKLDFSEESVEEEKADSSEENLDLSVEKLEGSEEKVEVSEEKDFSVEKVDLPEKVTSPSPTAPLVNNEKPTEEEEDSNRNVTSPVVLDSVVLDSVEQGS